MKILISLEDWWVLQEKLEKEIALFLNAKITEERTTWWSFQNFPKDKLLRKKWLISKKKGLYFYWSSAVLLHNVEELLNIFVEDIVTKIIATVEGSGELASLQILPLITDQVYFI